MRYRDVELASFLAGITEAAIDLRIDGNYEKFAGQMLEAVQALVDTVKEVKSDAIQSNHFN